MRHRARRLPASFRPAWNPVDQTRLALPCVTITGSLDASAGRGTYGHGARRTGRHRAGLLRPTSPYSPDGSSLAYRGPDTAGGRRRSHLHPGPSTAERPSDPDSPTGPPRTPARSSPRRRAVSSFGGSIRTARDRTHHVVNADGSGDPPRSPTAPRLIRTRLLAGRTRIAFSSDRSTGDPNAYQFWVMQGMARLRGR